MILEMPVLTKAYTAKGVYVIDKPSLRLAVLDGVKVIILGGRLELKDSIEFIQDVISNNKVR